MIRLAFTIAAGVLLGLVVHLVSVLALPKIAAEVTRPLASARRGIGIQEKTTRPLAG